MCNAIEECAESKLARLIASAYKSGELQMPGRPPHEYLVFALHKLTLANVIHVDRLNLNRELIRKLGG